MSCPLPGSQGHVPGSGDINTADIMFIGEAPGADEVAHVPPMPFVGKAGQMARRMLRDAGIDVSRVYFSNVLRCRPPENKYPTGKLREQCEACCRKELLDELQAFSENKAERKVIITAGAQALRALTGLDDISTRRGYVYLAGDDYAPSFGLDWLPAIIPTIHPAFLFRGGPRGDTEADIGTDWLKLTVSDYIKAARIVKTGSLRRPPSIWQELDNGPSSLVPAPQDHLTIDLEYQGSKIGLVGLGEGEQITVWSGSQEHLVQLRQLLAQAPRIVAHNAITADLPVLEQNRVIDSVESVLPKVVDTMIVQHLLYPDLDSGMDFWGSVVTDLPYWKQGDGRYGPEYCGRDVYGADRLYEVGYPGLEALQMAHCLAPQQQAQLALLRMSQRGVKMARERIPIAKAALAARTTEIETQLPFKNARSNPEVHAYYDEKGWLRKKHGKASVDKHALVDFIAKHDDPVARLLLEHRELSKIESTYLTPYEEIEGDVIHSRFDLTKQGTGRISSAEPNLFQLPKRPGKAIGDLGLRLVRGLIIPRHPEWIILEADWSQVELRLVVLFSGARGLQALLDAGVDIHGEYARRYGKSRDETKVGIHGGNYMASAYEIARNFDMPAATIEPILQQFRAENPEIPAWWGQVTKQVVANSGILRLPFGRIRRFSGKVADWEKAAVATLPQGTVADMLVRCLNDLERESVQHLEARILFPCHDSILWELPPEELPQVIELTRAYMERRWPELGMFFCPVEFKAGPTWAEVKKL